MTIATLTLALFVAAAPAPKPKLAAPGLEALNLSDKELEFFSEHFAHQFAFEGVDVVSAKQIAAVLGYERQKQLLGCTDDSACMAELGGALGADGILTGSLAKLDDLYQVDLKIVSPGDASNLAAYSARVEGGQKALLLELDKAAVTMARLMKERLGKKSAPVVAPGTPAVVDTKTQPATTAVTPPSAAREPTPETPPAAEVARRKNRLTFGPLGIWSLYLPLEYERALGNYVSLSVGTQLSLLKPKLYIPVQGFGIGGDVGLRLFPFGAAPSGLWLGAELALGLYADTSVGAFYTDGLALVGYTLVAKNGFTASAGLGAGFGVPAEPNFENLRLAVHANAGWAF